MVSNSLEPHDVRVRQLRARPVPDLVEDALRGRSGEPAPEPGWRVGTGMAMAMIDTIPPRGHFRRRADRACDADGQLHRPGRHGRIRQRHQHGAWQIAASALGMTPDRIRVAAPTPTRSATIPAPTAAPAWWWRASRRCAPPRRCARAIRARAAGHAGVAAGDCRLAGDAVDAPDGSRAGSIADGPLEAPGRADGTPRSVAFNVQAFRVAVHPTAARSGSCRASTPPMRAA